MLNSATKKSVSMPGKGDRAEISQSAAAEESGSVDAQEQPETAQPGATDTKVVESAATGVQQKSDTAQPDMVDTEPADEDAEEPEALDPQGKSPKGEVGRRVSVSLRTLLVSTLVTALLASLGIMTWLYLSEKTKLDGQARQAADNSHAERVALDYAVDAAKIDAKNLDTWKKNLVKGTTPELKEKLTSAAVSMEQILAPLQWNSTAIPLVAKVRTNTNGIYVVDTFVGVETKTVQAPDGLQSTATYGITIDSNHDWQITEVGGIGAVVGQK
jgi:Mce-associated membrane protein